MIWLAKRKKMKRNWTRSENLNICFCGSFDRYFQKLLLLSLLFVYLFIFFVAGGGRGGDWTLANAYTQFVEFLFISYFP